MSRIPMLDNILAQPASHRGLLALHQRDQHANLRACAQSIRNARGRVIFTGMGGSLFATLAAVSRLSEQGYPVQALESAELLHYGSASLRAEDVGVVISRSGGSIEPVLLAEKMLKAGMTVIGVTNVPGSRLESSPISHCPSAPRQTSSSRCKPTPALCLPFCCWRRRCWPAKA